MSNRSTLLLEHHLEELKLPTLKSDVGLDGYETRSPYQLRGRLWAGWHHHIAMCLRGGAFLLSLQQDGGKMPRITGSQGYRVVWKMLPWERFGPAELLQWPEGVQLCNEQARRPDQKRRCSLPARVVGDPSPNPSL